MNQPAKKKEPNRHVVGTAKQGDNEMSIYSGALPHPEHVKAWAAHVEDAPERIMRMIETEQSHRQEMESREMAMQEYAHPRMFIEAKRGQFLAAAINIFGIMAAVLLGYFGAMWPSAIIGGLCTVLLAGSYLQTRPK